MDIAYWLGQQLQVNIASSAVIYVSGKKKFTKILFMHNLKTKDRHNI